MLEIWNCTLLVGMFFWNIWKKKRSLVGLEASSARKVKALETVENVKFKINMNFSYYGIIDNKSRIFKLDVDAVSIINTKIFA